MINQLRAKLITVTMIAVAIMLIIIFALMNIMNFYHTTQNADDKMCIRDSPQTVNRFFVNIIFDTLNSHFMKKFYGI